MEDSAYDADLSRYVEQFHAGFIIILAAVIDKNVSGGRRDRFRG